MAVKEPYVAQTCLKSDSPSSVISDSRSSTLFSAGESPISSGSMVKYFSYTGPEMTGDCAFLQQLKWCGDGNCLLENVDD